MNKSTVNYLLQKDSWLNETETFFLRSGIRNDGTAQAALPPEAPLCRRSTLVSSRTSPLPILFEKDCGAFNALDVDQKEEAFPWAGGVAASSLSFSRFRYRIISLGERCGSSPFDSGGGVPPLRLMRTRFPRRERSNEREAPPQVKPRLLLPV